MAIKRRPARDQVERIRQLAGQNWTARRIADKLKLDVQTVYSYASLNEIAIVQAPNPYHAECKDRHAEIVKYTLDNPDKTRAAIAGHFGVHPSMVHRVLKEAGLPTTRQYDADGKVVDRLPAKA